MPSLYDIKPGFQALLRPLVRGLVRAGFTANQVTLAALALSVVQGATMLIWPGHRAPLLALPAVLLARMALNAIDGMLAREHNQRTRLGAVLNELGDVLADAAMYLPLAGLVALRAEAVIAMVTTGLIAEMAGVVALGIGASRRYDGPMGKSDRALLVGLVGLLLGLGVSSGWWFDAAFWAAAVLGLLTIVNRSRAALRECASEPVA